MPTSLTKTMGTVFILGAGPRVGLSVARVFKQNGYKVAIGSRNPDLSKAKKEGIYAVKVNLGETSAIEKAFADVRGTIGTSSIVVYNGKSGLFVLTLRSILDC
jgi:NAD(P)-dependent dehydrogenase (short-subunit alcohol dehydrogenase family)